MASGDVGLEKIRGCPWGPPGLSANDIHHCDLAHAIGLYLYAHKAIRLLSLS